MKMEFENRWHEVRARLAKAAGGIVTVAMAGTLMAGVVGCSGSSGTSSSSAQESSAATSEGSESADAADAEAAAYGTSIDESLYDLGYTDRDKDPSYDESAATKIALSGTTASVAGSGAVADGSTVMVSEAGVYLVEGELSDGQLLVEAPEDAKVQLVMAGASITNQDGAALYVKQADKCFVTLADGTANSLSDGEAYTFEGDETEPDAALFSECDLTLQGTGSLAVDGAYNDAVKTKDDLVVTGGTYEVNAKGDGLVGKDSVKVADGDVTVKTSSGDAIKSSKDDKEGKGFVSIDGGTISVDAADKGIKAATYARIAGGTLDITSADDALHSDGSGRICGGEISISADDDAVHVEYELQVDDGTVDIAKCYEGYEGQTITVNGGDTHIVASDDGMNASSPNSGSDQSNAVMTGDGNAHWMAFGGSESDGDVPEPPEGAGEGQAPEGAPSGEAPSGAPDASDASGTSGERQFGGRGQKGGGFGGGGGGMMDADEGCVLTINGGTVVVESQGDGLDSNGSIVLNGGVVYVDGPTSDGDGALDCGTTISSNGGTLIAVGSSGMAESFTDGTQPFGQVSLSGSAGEELTVTDASGAVLASFTPTKSYQNVVVTVPGFEEGQTYTVSAGSSSATLTASTTASSSGIMGQMPGGGGQRGARGGDMGARGGQGQGSAASQATQA